VPTSIGLAAHLAVAHLEDRGIDPGPLLASSGLSQAAVANRERVKVKSVIEFLDVVSRAVEDEWLGLTLAVDFDLREIGMLYYVAASSERFEDALKRLERYVRIADEALVVRIVKGADCRIELSYVGVPRHVDRHLMESFAVGLLRLFRQLVGRKIVPLAASFVHHRSDGRKIQRILGCEVSFDAYEDVINLDASVMDLPLVGYDPYLNELLVKNCEDAIVDRASKISPFRTEVESIIAPLLPHGEAQAKTVAQRIGLSERTFARRLAAEGLSFGEILDQLRRDLAVRYLAESLQASQIAWLLGFQQPSAFSHACRRWTGKSPSEFRRSRMPSLSPA
jgi:AraC-like DNA-binding protein